jgi:hypothetical protein
MRKMNGSQAYMEVFSVESILSNIFVFRVFDFTEQLACIKTLPKFLAEHPRVHRHVFMNTTHFGPRLSVAHCWFACVDCMSSLRETGASHCAGLCGVSFSRRIRRYGGAAAYVARIGPGFHGYG